MSTGRLEAFSDGVLAIIITVMVLELRTPEKADLHSLVHDSGLGLLTYVLSFIYVGIYWSNHHHMFQICHYVDGSVLWANLHLLFWLSLYPFTTTWVAESDLKQTPTVVYGVNLLAAGVAYYLLQIRMTQMPEGGEQLREVVGDDLKGKLSPVIYLAGHPARLRRALAGHHPVRRGGPDVAGARPAGRALPAGPPRPEGLNLLSPAARHLSMTGHGTCGLPMTSWQADDVTSTGGVLEVEVLALVRVRCAALLQGRGRVLRHRQRHGTERDGCHDGGCGGEGGGTVGDGGRAHGGFSCSGAGSSGLGEHPRSA